MAHFGTHISTHTVQPISNNNHTRGKKYVSIVPKKTHQRINTEESIHVHAIIKNEHLILRIAMRNPIGE